MTHDTAKGTMQCPYCQQHVSAPADRGRLSEITLKPHPNGKGGTCRGGKWTEHDGWHQS